MAQVGFPRLYSVHGVADSRWDLQSCFPTNVTGVQAAKAANPNLIVLMASQSNAPNGPIPSVTYSLVRTYPGATDNVVDGQASSAGVIRPFSTFWDELFKPDGTLANSFGTGSHSIFNLANGPYNTGIEDTSIFIARVILHGCKLNRLYRDNWDGYRSDNWMSLSMGGYGGSLWDSDRNGVQDDTATIRGNWGDGLNALGKFLRDTLPDKIVGGNVVMKFDSREGTWTSVHTDKNGWHKYANFAEIEDGERYLYSHTMAQRLIDMLNSTDSSIDPVSGSDRRGWLVYPDFYGQERYAALFFQLRDDANNGYLAKPANFNTPAVYKQEAYYKPARKGMALAYCAGMYYFPCFVQDFTSKLYYDDEMLGGSGINRRNWMGDPLAAATSPATNIFMREFENGLALVNVGSSSVAVTLPIGANNWRKIAGTASHNDGATISTSTFTLPAHDGRLLVRIDTAPPQPPTPPVNATLPTLSGTAVSGQALTPTYGTWLNTPTSYSVVFARYSGGTRLATLQTQSTLATYTIVAGDVGFTIRVEVVATNADGSSPAAISLATAVVQAPPELGPDDALTGPPSTIFDFTIGSLTTPFATELPWSSIFDFTISASRLVNFLRVVQTSTRVAEGEHRIGEGGGGI